MVKTCWVAGQSSRVKAVPVFIPKSRNAPPGCMDQCDGGCSGPVLLTLLGLSCFASLRHRAWGRNRFWHLAALRQSESRERRRQRILLGVFP